MSGVVLVDRLGIVVDNDEVWGDRVESEVVEVYGGRQMGPCKGCCWWFGFFPGRR